MKIAYILPSLINQGPIVVANNVVNGLVKKGYSVDVFYFDDIKVMTFDCPTNLISIRQPIDFDKYDIVHSHCLRPDWYVYRWRNKIHYAKIVTTLHQDTFQSISFKYNKTIAYLLTSYWCHMQSRFDGVIAISNQLKDTYDLRLKHKITTIYNGCSIEGKSEIDSDNINKINQLISFNYKIVGTYAYITRRKGLSQMIQALTLLTDYAFVVIGEGPEVENLKSQALSLDVQNRVLFLPYQREPFAYLPFFDIYVMPSYSEGFGLAMVEAALAHKAIVCSDIPSFHEIFSSNEVCFFELDNIDSLCKAVLQAYHSMRILGDLAYGRAVSNFTVTKMVENHLAYYQKLLMK